MNQVFYYNYNFKSEQNPDEVLSLFANLIEERFEQLDGHEEYTGIYLASSNAGVTEAIDFWASAVEKGPGFVFPQRFPLTLSNYPCGFFSRKLSIHGPAYTLIGDGEALIGSFDHAMMDLSQKIISYALIIGLDFPSEQSKKTELTFSVIHSNNFALKMKNELVKHFQQPDHLQKPSEMFRKCCDGIEITDGAVMK